MNYIAFKSIGKQALGKNPKVKHFVRKASYTMSVLNETENSFAIYHYNNTRKSKTDKMKKKINQIETRVIVGENRAKLVNLKTKWGEYEYFQISSYNEPVVDYSCTYEGAASS